MHCDDVIYALYAGESSLDIEIHLSGCDECRRLDEDLRDIRRACARARAEWHPSRTLRLRFPSVPWKRLAIAACLLIIPLAAGAFASLSSGGPEADASPLLQAPSADIAPTNSQILGALLFEEAQP